MQYGQLLCEIILNLCQWFRRRLSFEINEHMAIVHHDSLVSIWKMKWRQLDNLVKYRIFFLIYFCPIGNKLRPRSNRPPSIYALGQKVKNSTYKLYAFINKEILC